MTPAGRNPKVLATLAFVFLAGAATGALSMRMGLHEKLHRTVAAASQRAPKSVGNDVILQRFKTELNLSGDQTDKIAMVLDDYRHYYENLQDELDDVRATGKSRILQILNPEQRAKFDKIMAEVQPQIETKKQH
jgi:Spy/CpxP family protein refolding chaperone